MSTAADKSDLETEPHAVRWATRYLARMRSYDWTAWHWTVNSRFTVCGRPIIIGSDGGSFLPETHDDPAKVQCRICRRKIASPKLTI